MGNSFKLQKKKKIDRTFVFGLYGKVQTSGFSKEVGLEGFPKGMFVHLFRSEEGK